MKILKVGIHGASGRVGALLREVISEFGGLEPAALIVSSSSTLLGQRDTLTGLVYGSDLAAAVAGCDLIIDFSRPAASLELARHCANSAKPVLVATTGHSAAEMSVITEQARRCPILLASNTSLGVAVLQRLAAEAARSLGDRYEAEIVEIHHRYKRDAPSGTALTLAKAIAQRRGETLVTDRTDNPRPRGDREIGISSVRAGDVVGEHTIYFVGGGERLEITHRVSDRKVFAWGALELGTQLVGKAPGLYQVADFIGN